MNVLPRCRTAESFTADISAQIIFNDQLGCCIYERIPKILLFCTKWKELSNIFVPRGEVRTTKETNCTTYLCFISTVSACSTSKNCDPFFLMVEICPHNEYNGPQLVESTVYITRFQNDFYVFHHQNVWIILISH